ncbi:nucleolar complex protein 14 [Tilletia horrida]|uniref:Nucleolar complex protein 14 n=1 Tax=Tilletia horrida TaxID=155126 RepID=A0AAN6JSC0_9BASI|nr:nucleolar complex protein 14 [Tilletia horrida]
MAGGSQLAQLKARIKSEGISDRRQQSKSASKKKKHTKAPGDDSAAARAARLAAIVGENPFESKVTKPKHDVLTLKRSSKAAGVTGKPGAAKQAALSARQAQLLPEYQARAKAGSFVDRRFGENDPTLTPEERMLERFTKEKQRRSARNSSAFNLNDADADGDTSFELTHYGQTLSGLDDLDDVPLDDEQDEEEGATSGNIDKRTTSRVHFGGFQEKDQDDEEDGEERKKSKAEVMAEIIAKSKLAKHERQMIKDRDENLRHELDAELGDIRGLLFSMPADSKEDEEEKARKLEEKSARYGDPSKSGSNAIPLGGGSKDSKGKAKEAADTATAGLPASGGKTDSYDAFVRELAFDRRAKPTDRLKTEAELAIEQAELLQKQERARLKRMRGERDDSDDDEDGGARKKRGKRSGPPGADDLDDDFVLDGETAADVYGLGRGLSDMSEDEDEEDDEAGPVGSEDEFVGGDDEDEEEEGESEDEDEDDDAEEDDDGEDDEDDFGDLVDPDALAQPGEDEDEDVEGEHQDLVAAATPSAAAASSKKSKKAATPSKGAKETSTLPFTFPCPRSHPEFLALLEQHNVQPSDVPTVIKRIRTLYHPSLAEDNKFKLQAVLGVLLDHALYVAGLQSSKDAGASSSGGFDLVNALIPPIFELSKTYPLASAQHFVAKLTLMQRNLQRGLAAGALLPGSRTWPRSGGELALLRIAGAVWPTSDWQHPVSTPRALLIAQYLAHARIRCTGDVACALYLVTLVAEAEALSRRIVPEALNALGQVIALLGSEAIGATEEGWKRVQEAQVKWGLPMPDVGATHTANVGCRLYEDQDDGAEAGSSTLSLPVLLRMGPAEDAKEPARSQDAADQLLHTAFSLVRRFAKLYQGSPAFVELFEPFLALLSAFPAEGAALSARSGKAMVGLTHALSRHVQLAASSRRALRLQAHRAVSLATYVPKFDQEGRGGASRLRGGVFDPDPERAETAKLRAQLKREKKGAMRELRRDNAFLAEVREGERKEEDREYKKKMDKIMSGLQQERSEEKALAREKAKMKKRAGKK